MNFDLTTFILEILNFLVLMWLLQRFLYKPVLKVIAERQQSIEKQVVNANCRLEEADAAKRQYEDRLKQWDEEKSNLMAALRVELDAERARQLSKIGQELDLERKRAKLRSEKAMAEEKRELEHSAIDLAAKFTARVMSQLASPELERSVCKLFLTELRATNPEGARRDGAHDGQHCGTVRISTAFTLDSETRCEIESALDLFIGAKSTYEYAEDPALIAGIKVIAGGTVLQTNFEDAVTFFHRTKNNASGQ